MQTLNQLDPGQQVHIYHAVEPYTRPRRQTISSPDGIAAFETDMQCRDLRTPGQVDHTPDPIFQSWNREHSPRADHRSPAFSLSTSSGQSSLEIDTTIARFRL